MKKLYILTAIGICMAFAGCSEYSDPSDVKGTGESVTGITTTVPDNNGTNGESDWTSVVNSTTTVDVNVTPENTQTYIVYTDENGLVIGTVNEDTPEEEKITQPEGVSGSYAVIIDENGVVIGTSNGSVSPDVPGSDNPQGSTPVDTTTPTGTTTAPDNGGSGNGNGNGNSDSSQTTAFVEITPKTMYANVSATLKSSTASDAISLGTITKGSAVNVIGESGSYYLVKYNGITAFVSKGCVTDTKPQTETTTTTKNTSSKDTTTTTTKKSSATTTTTKSSTTTKKTTTIGTTTKATTTVGTTTKATTTTKKTTTTAKTTTTKKKTTTTTTKKATTTTTTTKKTTTTTTKKTTTTTTTTTSSGVKLPYDATTNAFINEVLRLTNEFRAENGVEPLELDLDLTAVAMVRADEITELFSHTRPDGTSWSTAFDEGGFTLGGNCGGRAENIAYGYSSAAAVVEAWKNSSGHRANMLKSSFNVIGIGFVNDGGVYYWTQEFAYLW
ncbi:MAG: CAP domain-containing protein [Oscillospiraceae bacterium]|nr:CAP domain-containing protein [Oscillospiraceae bacterium]